MERNMLFRELDRMGGRLPAPYEMENDFAQPFSGFGFGLALATVPPPPKLGHETVAGHTCYVQIDLGLGNKASQCYNGSIKTDGSFVCTNYVDKPIAQKTAIFAPSHFNHLQPADIVVYLHGHLKAHPGIITKAGNNSPDIQDYLNYNKQPYFKLREIIEASGKNMLLVAPTLGPRSQFGTLAANFNGFINQVVAAINEHLFTLKKINGVVIPGRIILAAHSGGGSPMLRIMQHAKSAVNIHECWGFDSWYGKGTGAAWQALANTYTSLKVFGCYYNSGRVPFAPDGRGKRKQVKNITIVKVAVDAPGKDHYTLVPWYFSERVNGAAVAIPAPATTPPARPAAPPLAPAPAGSTTGFALTTIPLSTTPIVVGKHTVKKKIVATVKEAPSVFVPEILRRALGSAGKDWFKNFTRITFLGRKLKSGDYVHTDFARVLKGVEQSLAAKYGGPGKDPKLAGDFLLGPYEAVSGSREVSSTATFSMHIFGLAVDMNYLRNPFIQAGDIKTVNAALQRAGWLVNGAPPKKYVHGMKYDDISILDKLLEQYFSLPDNTTLLTAKLTQQSSGSPWQHINATKAAAIIEQDLKDVAKKLARGSNRDVIKKGGILDLPKEFVEGMIAAGINWGGFYGDNMHFDMRDTGSGKKIDRERKNYAAEKNREAKEKYEREQQAAK